MKGRLMMDAWIEWVKQLFDYTNVEIARKTEEKAMGKMVSSLVINSIPKLSFSIYDDMIPNVLDKIVFKV